MKKYKWIEGEIHFSSFCLHAAQIFLFTMAAELLLTALLFVLGVSMQWFYLPLSFVIGVLCSALFWAEEKTSLRQAIYEILFCIILFAFFSFVSGLFVDVSWDGNAYHKLAVGLLKDGWNPLKQLSSDYSPEGAFSGQNSLWVEAYCKATWIFGTSVYLLTENIESAKAYTQIGMLCAFLITVYYLKKKGRGTVFCTIFSLAAAFSPVAVQQFDSFYVDGFLHSMLYILVIALLMGCEEDVFDIRISAGLIAAAMIICGNIKFTGLLYGGIFCIAFFVMKSIFAAVEHPKSWFAVRAKRGAAFFFLAIVTILWAGNSSYLTNLLRHGTPCYPLTGKNPADIMTDNSPFTEVNHLKNLFYSLFSRTDNFLLADVLEQNRTATLKIPFSVNWSTERIYCWVPDARIAGFGVFFSGILIICLGIIIYRLIRMKKDERFFRLLTLLIVCFGLTFFVKESWWARYSPYIYFIVLAALYLALESEKKPRKWLGAALAVLLLVNNLLPVCRMPERWRYSQQVYQGISGFSGKSVYVYSSYFPGTYYNLKDKDVYYFVEPSLQQDPECSSLYWDVRWKSAELIPADQ